jgi:NADH-quinone oxidoreductase subunit C
MIPSPEDRENRKMDNQFIAGKLKEAFPDKITGTDDSSDMLTITVSRDAVHEVIRFLKEDESLGFNYLTDITGVHYPGAELPFAAVYHLHNFVQNIRVRIKTFLPGEDPSVKTMTDIFSGANWMERETYDFFGIRFEGHPNLKRILNVEYLDYFPMRKEYPLEDPTREDKDDRFFGR